MIDREKIALLAIPFLLFFAGCGISRDIPAGTEGFAESYLEKFKNADYAGMYGMLDAETAKKTPRSPYISWHEDIINKAGAVQSYKRASPCRHSSDKGEEVSFSYDVDFVKGKGTLVILILKKGGRFSVLHTIISLPENSK